MPRLKQLISSAAAALLVAFCLLPSDVGAQGQAGPQSVSPAIRALMPVPQVNRVGAGANFSRKVPMGDHLPVWARSERQVSSHSVDLSSTLRLWVTLQRDPAVQAAFDQLLKDQQTPGSPLYHQWLTPQQIGELYGPTSDDVAAVQSWLTSQGFTVDSVSPSRMRIALHGTVATATNAFQTSFAYFQLGTEERRSNISAPLIPAALSGVVEAISGLSEIVPAPQRILSVKPPQTHGSTSADVPSPNETYSPGRYYYVSAKDFATIYDINPVYGAGDTGAMIGPNAQHVAIIARSHVAASDISTYASFSAVSGYTLNQIVVPGTTDPGTPNNGDTGEAVLDVERVVGTATGATVDLVISNDGSLASQMYYNVDTLLDPVMSISFGACEVQGGSVTSLNTLFSQAAAEGITTLVSSGDSGASGCELHDQAPNGVTALSPNFLCSSSYVTCVGGTEFNDAGRYSTYWSSTNGAGQLSALSYIPEGAWNDPGSAGSYQVVATGGGVSAFITKPGFQTGPGVPADGFRDTPDISFTASAQHDGYLYCYAYEGATCTSQSTAYLSGGTSATAPGMAGIVALLNTKMGAAQGNINPLLYSLAQSTPSAFHDATVASSGVSNCSTSTPSMCNNTVPGSASSLTGGVPGYQLTAGYDQATGLGSLDVANFLNAVAASTILLEATSTHTGTFQPGDTADTYTLSVSNGGTAASNGTVTVVDTLPVGFTASAISGAGWSCDLPSVTCTRSDAVAAGASYPAITLTVSVSNSDSGSYTNMVSISGGGEGASPNWSSSDITVVGTLSPAVLSLSFSPSRIEPNGTSTFLLTVQNPGTNGGALRGVAFNNTLPAGVTTSNVYLNCSADASQTSSSISSTTVGLSGGTLSPGTSCYFTGSATASAQGIYTDTTSTVTAANGNTGAAVSATLTVSVVPTKVVITGNPATPITAGGNAGMVQVKVEDAGGYVATNISGTLVTLTVTGPNNYSQTTSIPTANGVVTFDLSTVRLAAAGSYTYTASSSGLTSASVSETVNVGPFAGIALSGLTSVPRINQSQSAIVRGVDSYGNTVPSFTGAVQLTSTAPSTYYVASSNFSGYLPYTYTFKSSDAGTHTFQIQFTVAGTWSVQASYMSYTATQSNLVVSPSIILTNANGNLLRLTEAGTVTSPSGGTSTGTNGTSPAGAIAAGATNAVFSLDAVNSELIRFNYNGQVVSGSVVDYYYPTTFSGGGLSTPTALAVDGLNQIWVANAGNNSVSLFGPTAGTTVSPSTGFTGSSNPYSAPSGVAIDVSGNVWVTNKNSNTVTEILGAAAPAAPLSTAAANLTTGTRP